MQATHSPNAAAALHETGCGAKPKNADWASCGPSTRTTVRLARCRPNVRFFYATVVADLFLLNAATGGGWRVQWVFWMGYRRSGARVLHILENAAVHWPLGKAEAPGIV